jgi:monoamine oxidase
VAVYESSDHVGGRVRTDRDFIPGKTVEAGAELIGVNHPMWFALAEMFGLQMVEMTEYDDLVTSGLWVRLRIGDHDLSADETAKVYAELEPVIDTIGEEAKDIDPATPWLSPNAAGFDAMSVGERLDDTLLPDPSSLTRKLFEFVLANDNCASVYEQSYLGLLALVSAGRVPAEDEKESLRGYWEYTETHRCGGGNDQLAHQLSAGLADLLWLNNGVVSLDVREGGVAVTTGEGSGLHDYVVLTPPPNVWPAISSYLPWDPSERTMSHGPAVKYLNSFATRFWEDSGLAPNALWDELGSVWESTDGQPLEPEYGLSVYSGGPHVLAESDYATRLGEIFPGYAPTGAKFVDWPTEPGIETGYSVPSPGQVTTVAQALAEPHGDRLYFAGEHSYVPYFGYMEGALQSGARAAREIIRTVCPDVFR